MLTVLHTESSKGWGGQENRTLQECIGLKKRGARAIILCQPGSILGERAAAAGIEVKTCRMKKSYDLSSLCFISKLIKIEKIDIINTHSGRDSLLAGIAGRLSRTKPRIVRTRHLALPISSKTSYSLLPHKVVTVSEYVRQYLIKEGVPSERIATIPTGIDPERFNPESTVGTLRQELNLGEDVSLVGTVAILRYKKGHHILLEAIPLVLNAFPSTIFVFAGDGPQKENIAKKIENLGVSRNVIMLGLRQDIPNVLKSIDLFVLPTLQEALGTSFIEAMAMGKPVIGTNVGGVGEVILNGRNGHLVAPNNPRALADAVIRAILNRRKAAAIGAEGVKTVRQRYTVDKMCDDMYALYASLLPERA
jgi:glycosyltransferase involved in cell wall biosynthesis